MSSARPSVSTDGRVALVTGGAGGIGAATARQLAGLGTTVLVADIDFDRAGETAASIGPPARACRLDAGDPESWARLAQHVFAEHGGVDVVVNNAFFLVLAAAHQLDAADWNRQLAVDLGAVYHCAHHFGPSLAARGGSMVNVASVHAEAGYRGHPAYAAAKGGMVALTRQLAVEYSPARINAVLPGSILTRIWDDVSEDERAAASRLTTLGRLGRAEEVASAIAFLAGDGASYITGTTLVVDGGLLAWRGST
jgi:NAD(P)-dependent dehydrogenase (short-subunit alcohol dehydrogenase family)